MAASFERNFGKLKCRNNELKCYVGLPFPTYIRKFIGHLTSKNHKVMNQIDEPASYGIGIENIFIYFGAPKKKTGPSILS